MMVKGIVFLLSALPFSEAFVISVQQTRVKATSPHVALKGASSATTPNQSNDALTRLQHEYKVLQEKLLSDVVIKHDEEDAELIEEQMIEIATQATKIQEEKQIEVMGDAEQDHVQAQHAREQAEALKKGVDETEEGDAAVKGIFNEAYDELVKYSDYKELEATHKMEAAKLLLKELKENEKRLEATLQALREEKKNSQKSSAALEEELHAQHRSFLDKVKDAVYAHPDILLNLDPHIL